MRETSFSGQFKRDVKRAQKRGKDLEKLKTVLKILVEGTALDAKYLDHPLKGNWKNFRDLHIEPDWLLIYKLVGNIVRFERTGRHADIFEN